MIKKKKLVKKTTHEANKWKNRTAEISEIVKEAQTSSTGISASNITQVLALDCEYVGVGYNGKDDCLARVSIVNSEGECIYDRYVRPTDEVTDYRTGVSGIRPGNLVNGEQFRVVQQEVHKILAGKVVVGHAIQNDFRVLELAHPARLIRDTARYKPLRGFAGCTRMPSLKLLAEKILGVQIQTGEHDSVTDAKMALRIYMMHKKKWDQEHQRLHSRKH
ncbi:RNA exonuclease 4 [Aphelenchoides avenae]|nr:RNA exonuclease 4 [Aphelenchus avenae]